MLTDLSLVAWIWLAVITFGAAFVRGYSGFGNAALLIAGASLVADPMVFVPVIIVADIVLTLLQARDIRAHIDWKRILPMLVGSYLTIPVGVQILSRIGIDTARSVIAVFILVMCGFLLAGWRLHRMPGKTAHAGVGMVAGLANGASIGGLPAAAFFAASGVPAATFRASIIAYFTLMDLWTLPNMMVAGLVGRETLILAALGLPLMIAGIWAGSRHFLRASPESFRRFAIWLLAGLSVLSLAKAVIG